MKKIMILIAILTLLLTGCNGERNEVPDANYHTGTQGIQMRFLENAPPYKIYHTDPLEIMLEITNRGATNIVNGKIYLSGFDPKYLDITPTETTFTIEGKSLYNPDGRLNQVLTFTDPRIEIPEGADSMMQNIKATACYQYRTQGQATVCIDPNPRSATTKVCTPGSVGMGGGQGGPVAVTSIDQESSRDMVTFKINIQNAGGGTLFDTHKGITRCHTSLETKDLDIVDLRATLSDTPLECQPNGGQGIRLINGQGYVYCYYKGVLGEDAFNTQLSVELDYAYRDSISTSIEIVNI